MPNGSREGSREGDLMNQLELVITGRNTLATGQHDNFSYTLNYPYNINTQRVIVPGNEHSTVSKDIFMYGVNE